MSTVTTEDVVVCVDGNGRVTLGRLTRAGMPLARNYRVTHQGKGVLVFSPIETEEQRWVPVAGWPEAYEISDSGTVIDIRTGKVVLPRLMRNNSRDAAQLVRLRLNTRPDLVGYGPKENPYVYRSVAQLVLESFGVPRPDDGPDWAPGFLNDDNTDASLTNVFWRKRSKPLQEKRSGEG